MSVSLKSCLLVFILSVTSPSLCLSAPSEPESMTNFLNYIDSLKGCVVKNDLKSCSNAVKGKLLEKEQRSVEQIQKDIQKKCFDNIAGGSVGMFNCYLTWLAGSYDALTQKIMKFSEVRERAFGNAFYTACTAHGFGDKSRVQKCFKGCNRNNFLSCKKMLDICLTTKNRGAMEVCVKKGIDIRKNPHF